ncbi:MAG: exodeoxyribonuclease VII small subunit [Rhodocyclaceae bacterium]|nr:exodeoxyribonuclease VII small subunit [Rhodocyclaceae bacterium]
MKSAAKPPVSFEAALQELESLVQTLESGGAALEDSLQAYERGAVLLKHCQETLAQAEQKIRILDGGSLRDFSATANPSDESQSK